MMGGNPARKTDTALLSMWIKKKISQKPSVGEGKQIKHPVPQIQLLRTTKLYCESYNRQLTQLGDIVETKKHVFYL